MSIFWNPMEAVDLLEMPLPIITEGTQDMGNGVYWLRAGTPLDEYFAVANNEDAKYLVAEDFYFYSNKPDQAKVVPLITAGYIDINKAEEAAGITYSDECLVALEKAGIILAAATIALSETQIQDSVDNWLDEHPEATTTVQDGAITKAKLDENLQGKIDEVDDLKSATNTLAAATALNEYGTISVTPTITTGKKREVNGNTLVETADQYANYMTISAEAGDVFFFSGRWTIYISGAFFLNGDTLLSYEHYNTSTETVTDYRLVCPDNCDTLIINYSIAVAATLKKRVFIAYKPKLGSASKYWTVQPDGFGDYTTIGAACSAASDGDMIVVYPGTYREQINIYGKELHIKGVDKRTCILIDSSSDYRTPPLRANLGSVSNMTIIEDAANPPAGIDDVTTDGHPVKNMAYCIHSDSADGVWNFQRTEFVVEDCILKNANRPGIGAGLYPYHKITIRNCVFESGAGVVSGYERGALYVHNNASQSGVNEQKLSITDCLIKCDDSIVLYLLDSGGTGTGTVELINNNVFSTTNGVDPTIVHNDATPTNTEFQLLANCYGNNIASMNA